MQATTHDIMPMTTDRPSRGLPRSRGFTVIELLVVISIMIILLAALAPAVFNVDQNRRLIAAKNTIQSGAQATRALATRKRAALFEIAAANDSGTALIFAPSGELRLALSDQRARCSNAVLQNSRMNGFRDVPDRQYIELPRGIAVAGIIAPLNGPGGPGAGIVPPPFALRYDEQGGLVSGVPPANVPDRSTYAFYDANFNGDYCDGTRANPVSSYELSEFDPRTGNRAKWFLRKYPGTSEDLNVWALPFGQLEPVIGVIIYAKGDFEDQGLSWKDNPTAAANWLATIDADTGDLKNGKLLLFSRYSGSGIQ